MGGHMKFLLLISAILLGACDQNATKMVCGEYDVKYDIINNGDAISAVINGDKVTLNIAISGSGARYVGELNGAIVTLWNSGPDWTMFLNDGAPISCTIK